MDNPEELRSASNHPAGPVFEPRHLRDFATALSLACVDETGECVPGVTGRTGAAGQLGDGAVLGADLIEMAAGSSFRPHTHPGAHILFILAGEGVLTICGETHALRQGMTAFIPAELLHAVSANEGSPGFRILAIGVPYHPIDSPERMRSAP
jgi:quercetin dioxygenase-like cupin family protein